jgi:hypothetical protein
VAAKGNYVVVAGLSAVFGPAIVVSIAAHVQVYRVYTWPEWLIALLILSGLAIGLVYLIMKRLICAATVRSLHAQLILLLMCLVVSGLFVVVEWFLPKPLLWRSGVGTQPQPPLASLDRKAWDERHRAIELHATANDEPQWTSLTHSDLPRLIKRFGGTIRFLVTQPEWAVFDEQRQIYKGGDGVEVRFMVQQNGEQRIIQQLNLNLHVHPEQRRWQLVQLSVPSNIQNLAIEALPGPPGSNNWYDRVWVSVGEDAAYITSLARLADWLSFALFMYLVGITMRSVLPPPYVGWRKVAPLLALNIVVIGVCLSLGEIYLRMKGFGTYERTFPGQYQNKPDLSWARPDSYFGWVVSNKNNPEINPQGFRDPKDFSIADVNSDRKRVMILGDSFMFGAGVGPNENTPSFLQAQLQDNFDVFNFGVGAWGIDQMYLAYEKYKNIIHPQVVILAFIDEDVDRVLEAYRVFEGMNKPSFVIKNGELAIRTSDSKKERVLNSLMSESVFLSFLIRHLYLLREAKFVATHVLLKIAKEGQRDNCKFVVIRIPTKENANSITTWMRSLYSFEGTFNGHNVQYLEPLEEMKKIPGWTDKFYLKNDGHMSAAGNKYLADYIYGSVFGSDNQRKRRS